MVRADQGVFAVKFCRELEGEIHRRRGFALGVNVTRLMPTQ